MAMVLGSLGGRTGRWSPAPGNTEKKVGNDENQYGSYTLSDFKEDIVKAKKEERNAETKLKRLYDNNVKSLREQKDALAKNRTRMLSEYKIDLLDDEIYKIPPFDRHNRLGLQISNQIRSHNDIVSRIRSLEKRKKQIAEALNGPGCHIQKKCNDIATAKVIKKLPETKSKLYNDDSLQYRLSCNGKMILNQSEQDLKIWLQIDDNQKSAKLLLKKRQKFIEKIDRLNRIQPKIPPKKGFFRSLFSCLIG